MPTPSDNTTPTDNTAKIWIQLARSHQRILSAIEKSLKEAGLPALAWYDVLLELERVGANGIRPFELQEKLLLPQYGLSRLIERIEQAGLLERQSCHEDGRGQRVFISQAGQAIRKKMWVIYGATLVQTVGEKLGESDQARLAALLLQLR